MSTAQSGKTKSFRSLGSLSMLSSLPQPVIRDLDSKLILAKHSAGSVLYRQGELAESIFFTLCRKGEDVCSCYRRKDCIAEDCRAGRSAGSGCCPIGTTAPNKRTSD